MTLQTLLSDLSDLFFPDLCPGCKQQLRGPELLCLDCSAGCPASLTPLLEPSLVLTQVHAWVSYQSALALSWRVAKYRPEPCWLRPLSEPFSARVRAACLGPFSCVVPVPQSRKAYRKRRCFPVGQLARDVSAKLGCPQRDVLRMLPGKAQASLPAERERRSENLQGRLRLSSGVRGSVLLVDDVMTTGATLHACAKLLLDHGAEVIQAAVLCSPRVAS